jgi:hypothetical protein
MRSRTWTGCSVAALAAIAGCSLLPSPSSEPRPIVGADATGALFRDLDAGQHVAGIPLGRVEDVPSEPDLRQRPIGRSFATLRWQREFSGGDENVLLLDGLENGDFEELRFCYRADPRGARLVAVDTRPAARVDDDGAAFDARLASFRLARGPLLGFSAREGALFATSSANWCTRISRSFVDPVHPIRRTLVRVIDRSGYLKLAGFLTLEEALAEVNEVVGSRSRMEGPAWREAFDCGFVGGSEEARAVWASYNHHLEAVEFDPEQRLDAAWGGASPALRAKLLAALADGMAEGWRLRGTSGSGLSEVARRRAEFRAELDRRRTDPAANVDSPRTVLVCGLAADALDRDRSDLSNGGRNLDRAALAAQVELFTAQAELFGLLESCGSGDERDRVAALRAQGVLARSPRRSELARQFVERTRERLANEFEMDGADADAKGLVAAACANYLIADVLRTPAATRAGRKQRPIDRALTDLEHEAPLRVRALVKGVALAKQLVPQVVIHGDVPGNWSEAAYAQGQLLSGMPLSEPKLLGLVTGPARLDYGPFESFVYVLDPPVTVELLSGSGPWYGHVTIADTARVANDSPEVARWLARRDELAARIAAAQGAVGLAQDSANHVTGTESTQDVWFGNEFILTREGSRETTASLMARIQAGQRAQELASLSESLDREWAELLAEQPPQALERTKARQESYLGERQDFTLRQRFTVRPQEGDAVSISMRSHFTWLRHKSYPELGVAAVDEWRTEAQVAADPACLLRAVPAVVTSLARQRLEASIAAYFAQLDRRDLPDADRAAEKRWCRRLFDREALTKGDGGEDTVMQLVLEAGR